MRAQYEPYVLRRLANGRLFFVNHTIPFELSADCFGWENPFFLVSQLPDGRMVITVNPTVISYAALLNGQGVSELLPANHEYVTLRRGIYPVIMTAHPVTNVNEWLQCFEKTVRSLATQTLGEFVGTFGEFIPLRAEGRVRQQEPVSV